MKATRNTSMFVKAALAGLALAGASMAQASPAQFDPALTQTCGWNSGAGMYVVGGGTGSYDCDYFTFSSADNLSPDSTLVRLTKRVGFFDVNVNCVLELTGLVIDDTNTGEVVIQVENVTATAGDALCSGVSFPGTTPTDASVTQPWIARVTHANAGDLPASDTDNSGVAGTFIGVQVSTSFLGSCNGNVPVTFRNTRTNGVDEASRFEFQGVQFGGCTVNGVVSHDDVDVWH